MTIPPPPPPAAGWHRNGAGQVQWWDGASWGPLAPGESPVARVAPAGQVHTVFLPPAKTRTAAYWLAILLGTFGAHRFYLREFGTAWLLVAVSIVSFLFRIDPDPRSPVIGNALLVFVALWVVVDLFLLPEMVDAANARRAERARRY